MPPTPWQTTVEKEWDRHERPPAETPVGLESLVEPLTRREHEILRLLAQGLTAPEIAQQLVLALSTVKSYVQHTYEKLGVHGRREAVARGRALGLLESGSPKWPDFQTGREGGSLRPWPGVSLVGAEPAPMRLGLESLAAMVPAGYVLVLLMPKEMVAAER
jgi:DNA-binding CsgD family transcriptional regulator